MLTGRGVSSRRLGRVWMVFLLAHGEEAHGFYPSRRFAQGFLDVDQSAWRGTLVNSLVAFTVCCTDIGSSWSEEIIIVMASSHARDVPRRRVHLTTTQQWPE